MTNQAFGVGDIAIYVDDSPKFGKREYTVKITECILDDAGDWWYRVTPIGYYNPIPMDIAQDDLRSI